MPLFRLSSLVAALGLLVFIASPARAEDAPPSPPPAPVPDGLVLWLDAAKATTDATRHVTALADGSSAHHDAKPASPNAAPTLGKPDNKGRTMLHFTGKEALAVDAIRPASGGGVTVFVVYVKDSGQQNSGANSILFFSRIDASKPATDEPNFLIPGPDAASPVRYIKALALDNLPIGPITIGQNFTGNIGEVLVYDHVFASEGERRKVLEYLQAKWDANFDEPGWVRKGALDPIPQRTHDDLPLSDQANAGKWALDPKFTDEFEGTSVDQNRWQLFHTQDGQWWGREPGYFSPKNVTVHDGALHLKLDKAKPGDIPANAPAGKYQYTTGYLETKDRTFYGYYEIESKIAYSEFDNAFWFTNTGDPNNGLEIDVYEIGPHSKGYPFYDFMTAHVWGENGDKRHWGSSQIYQTPWKASDAFHVYGLEWTKDYLTWYIDGSPVRKLKNTNWHLPQKLVFDAEPMVEWFGPIHDEDFPAEYAIKYVRAWRQPDGTPDSTPAIKP